MLRLLSRLLRHFWLDAGDARRLLDDAARQRLREQVAQSEQLHSGEICLCIEGGLPSAQLWQLLRHRQTAARLTRERALHWFSLLQVWDTPHNNGVLIYLLLAERSIELVADRGLSERIDAQRWGAVVHRLEQHLCDGRFEDGLGAAIQEVSALLVETHALQAGATSGNELPDEPVFV